MKEPLGDSRIAFDLPLHEIVSVEKDGRPITSDMALALVKKGKVDIAVLRWPEGATEDDVVRTKAFDDPLYLVMPRRKVFIKHVLNVSRRDGVTGRRYLGPDELRVLFSENDFRNKGELCLRQPGSATLTDVLRLLGETGQEIIDGGWMPYSRYQSNEDVLDAVKIGVMQGKMGFLGRSSFVGQQIVEQLFPVQIRDDGLLSEFSVVTANSGEAVAEWPWRYCVRALVKELQRRGKDHVDQSVPMVEFWPDLHVDELDEDRIIKFCYKCVRWGECGLMQFHWPVFQKLYEKIREARGDLAEVTYEELKNDVDGDMSKETVQSYVRKIGAAFSKGWGDQVRVKNLRGKGRVRLILKPWVEN